MFNLLIAHVVNYCHICHIWNQHPQICLFAKFHEKTRTPKFGTKNTWFEYFGAGILKTIVIFEIGISNLSICRISRKTKMPKLRTENALFEYFWARILESCCHIWNQHLRISATAKFCEETNMPKFGTKNALLGIFDQQCLIWVFSG